MTLPELETELQKAQERRRRAMKALPGKHKGGEMEEFRAASAAVLKAEAPRRGLPAIRRMTVLSTTYCCAALILLIKGKASMRVLAATSLVIRQIACVRRFESLHGRLRDAELVTSTFFSPSHLARPSFN
jgi:hypothetical protein